MTAVTKAKSPGGGREWNNGELRRQEVRIGGTCSLKTSGGSKVYPSNVFVCAVLPWHVPPPEACYHLFNGAPDVPLSQYPDVSRVPHMVMPLLSLSVLTTAQAVCTSLPCIFSAQTTSQADCTSLPCIFSSRFTHPHVGSRGLCTGNRDTSLAASRDGVLKGPHYDKAQ